MSKLTSPATRTIVRAAISALLVGICSPALADGASDRGSSSEKLVVGLHHVSPEYKGGMKFRSPESIDEKLVEALAERLHRSVSPVPLHRLKPTAFASSDRDKTTVALTALPYKDLPLESVTVVPAGYYASPMAIMRSDTDIKSWEQLKGRKVCVSEGGLYVGTLAAKYGALEKVQRAPADSLLALRTGECDAAVHESALLDEMIQLPEWKKFSARLTGGPRRTVAFIVPSSDKDTVRLLRKVTDEWSATGLPRQLMKKNAQHIAFEVYLDQNVPDCH
jgi:polar amino acid transport system substrate-binding protein